MNKTESLKYSNQYKRAYKKGKFAVTKDLVVYVFNNRSETNRLGITIKKTIGKSVQRNRFRRLIKENYRIIAPDLKNGFDFVFVVRKTDEPLSYLKVKDSMEYMFGKLNMFRREK